MGQTMGATDENTVFEPDGIYTAAEVAEKLRLSRSSVLQRARVGDLPSLKLGQRAARRASVRFLGREVNTWLESKRIGTCAASSRTSPSRPTPVDRMRDFQEWRDQRQRAGRKCLPDPHAVT
jgi:hypothetical protein